MQSLGDYEYGQSDLIGHGAFALVFRGQHKKTGLPVAVKQILLKNIPGKLTNIRQKEITILKDLKHNNIVQLFDCHETNTELYLIMEYCNGGDLAEYLQDKKTLSEESIRHLSVHVALALKAIKQRNIIHRDIKPQNLLLCFPRDKATPNTRHFRDSVVKLADFGFARYLQGADMAATLCGSPLYMAPEILLGLKYEGSADLWSTGIILYQCLTGSAPFLASTPHALRKRFEKEHLRPRIPTGTSESLSHLLLSLIKKKPRERLTHDELLSHPFLRSQPLPKEALSTDELACLHAKSSPVPIRKKQTTASGYSISPQSAASNGRRNSAGSGNPYYSPSSGPPTMHNIGSNTSVAQMYTSPRSDVTDQGFILVDCPVTMTPASGRMSSSPQSATSPGSFHSSTHHTPSSFGSVPRFSSLVTPFYHQPQVSSPPSMHPAATASPPTTKLTRASPHSPQSLFTQQHAHTGRDNTAERQLVQAVPPLSANLTRTPPFASLTKLVAMPMAPGETPSPQGANGSSYKSLTRDAGVIVTLKTTGLVAGGVNSDGTVTPQPFDRSPVSHRKGLSGSRRGSSTKLTTLVESRHEGVDAILAVDDIVTPSLLLESHHLRCESGELLNKVSPFDENDCPGSKDLTPTTSDGNYPFSERKGSSGMALNLSQELADIRRRSQELSTKQGLLGTDLLRRGTGAIFQIGGGSGDGSQDSGDGSDSMCGSGSPSQAPSPRLTMTRLRAHERNTAELSAAGGKQPLSRENSQGTLSDDGNVVNSEEMFSMQLEEDADHFLCLLLQGKLLANELLRLARSRQSPMLLISTSMGDSGGMVDHVQKFAEQLVLCTKASSVLTDAYRQYEIELATSSCEPSRAHKQAVEELHQLQKLCLEKARLAKELHFKCLSKRRVWVQNPTLVSAEKLVFSQAVDLCKQAVLEDMAKKQECIHKYKAARMLFNLLLSDARTHGDRILLQKYITSIQKRLQVFRSSS